MRKLLRVLIVTIIVLTVMIPIHYRGYLVAYADTINSSNNPLQALGIKAIDAQIQAIHILQTSNVKLFKLPHLNSSQDTAKEQIKKWLEEIHPKILAINQDNMRFIRKFNTYNHSINNFIDKNSAIDQKKIFRMLKNLKDQNQSNENKLQTEIATLTNLQIELDKCVMQVSRYADEGIQLLDDLGGTKKHNLLATQIINIKKQIDTDLENIMKFPESISTSAWELFYFSHKKSNLIMNDGLKYVLSLFEDEQAVTLGTFDILQLIDSENVKRTINQFKETTTMSQMQLQSLRDIVEQNHKLYELTKQLKLTEIQASRIIDMKHNIQVFSKNIHSQINILIEHQLYIQKIKKTLSELMQLENPVQIDVHMLEKHIRLLQHLCENLEKQTNTFEKLYQ
ncbi:MAG: HBL/NHE enterotoxin family protein [Bacillus sp. (in: firmicutes)]|uniref:HBL/NHE enterotoxin family protein n=1 Tax=Bacillus sp. TaxID=1409 RepID=UPI0039E5597C